jgi:hypothetical protein
MNDGSLPPYRLLVAALLIACLAGCSTAAASTDHRAAEVDAATVFSYATFVGPSKPAPTPAPAPPRPGNVPQLPEPDPISTPEDQAPSDEPAQPEQHAAAIVPSLAELIEQTVKQRNAEREVCTGPRCGKSQASAPARPLRRALGGLFRRG